ncbi:MAG TPA: hypothetical protein VHY36_15745 [Steroidobacteraceae bacterium]|nr:hypothetical protein [Steroidobacteraceae bacterium]
MILDRARARTGALGALRLWICGFVAALAAMLAGCSTSTNVSNGTPVVTVNAQAAQDYSTYVVGVSLYSLTRSDGYISYPAGYTAEEFADLTQRVDLTELLNAVGIPTGSYTSVVIGIDYSIPIVYLNGSTTAATVENASGAADPGIIYVTVKLDPSHPLVVGLNKSTPLALDFNLAASNQINTSTNVVTVRPFVEAVTPPNDTEPVRARGLTVVANPGQNNFIEDLRPFEDNIYSTVGALTVNTTATTYFNIDGTVLTGTAGLEQLNKVASNTPIEAYGTLGDMSSITPGFTATQVYAGTVVSNGEYEHVRGVVSAVSGDTLSVIGSTYLYYEGYCQSNLCFTYYPSAKIDVSSSTVVTEDNVDVPASSLSAKSISVGSQIDAIGVGSTSSTNALTLDASSGLVRLQSTPIWGTLNSGASGTATLNLLSMGNTNFAVNSTNFNFAGTGTSSATDATAASYEVNTAAATPGADQSATVAATVLRVDGFPTPVGTAPPDFTATDAVPGTSEPANLVVEWGKGAGTTAPFTSSDASSLALNLANSDLAAVLIGPTSLPLTGTPAINIAGGTQFAIGNSTNGVSMFSTPSAFVSGLGSSLNGSTSVFRVVALGSYDSATNTFTASRVEVSLE